MINAFAAYIKNIAVFALLMAFAEIFMPDSAYKKYIGFILGIILAVSAVSPAFNILSGGFSAEGFIEEIEKNVLEEDYEIENNDANAILKSIFKANIKSSVENELKKFKAQITDVEVETETDTDGNEKIQGITIKIENYDGDTEKMREEISAKYDVKNVEVINVKTE